MPIPLLSEVVSTASVCRLATLCTRQNYRPFKKKCPVVILQESYFSLVFMMRNSGCLRAVQANQSLWLSNFSSKTCFYFVCTKKKTRIFQDNVGLYSFWDFPYKFRFWKNCWLLPILSRHIKFFPVLIKVNRVVQLNFIHLEY